MATASITLRPARRHIRSAAIQSQIVVIDPKKLRQAAIVRLIEDWATTNGLIVLAISEPEDIGRASNCAIVVLNVGGASVLEAPTQFWMRLARSALAPAPLVVFSDREERNEISAAFDQGARGFIATNLEPNLALEALTFLRRGGSFFPPSTIHQEHQSPPIAHLDASAPLEAASIAGRTTFRVSARLPNDGTVLPFHGGVGASGTIRATVSLTPRENDVLDRLREGKANKLIARDLNMTEATVKVHMRQIMRKLGVANRTQAVLCANGIGSARDERDR